MPLWPLGMSGAGQTCSLHRVSRAAGGQDQGSGGSGSSGQVTSVSSTATGNSASNNAGGSGQVAAAASTASGNNANNNAGRGSEGYANACGNNCAGYRDGHNYDRYGG